MSCVVIVTCKHLLTYLTQAWVKPFLCVCAGLRLWTLKNVFFLMWKFAKVTNKKVWFNSVARIHCCQCYAKNPIHSSLFFPFLIGNYYFNLFFSLSVVNCVMTSDNEGNSITEDISWHISTCASNKSKVPAQCVLYVFRFKFNFTCDANGDSQLSFKNYFGGELSEFPAVCST